MTYAPPPIPIAALISDHMLSDIGKRYEWTCPEETTLRQYYPVGGVRECLSRLPRRSVHAIRTHANSLGLKAPAYRPVGRMQRLESNAIFDDAIRNGYSHQKPGFLLNIARQIGRSEGWIKHRAAELGIVIVPLRGKPWSQEEDRLLGHGTAQGLTLGALANLLKQHDYRRSLPAIRSRLVRIGVALNHDCETTGLYTVSQLATLFGSEWKTIKKWIDQRGLPAKRNSDQGEWQIARKDLRTWVMANLTLINLHTLDKFWFAWLLYED